MDPAQPFFTYFADHWLVVFPEIHLASTAVLLLFLELVVPQRWKRALLALVAVAASITSFYYIGLAEAAAGGGEDLFFGLLHLSHWAFSAKQLMAGAMVLAVLVAARRGLSEPFRARGEYYALLFTIQLGGFLLVSTQHFLMMLLAVEAMSLSSYLLVSYGLRRHSAEVGLKYLLFGGVASATMLFGMSLLFGLTGHLQWGAALGLPGAAAAVACGLVLVGLLFKAGLVPLHLWVPDTYQEAPSSALALLSTLPKVAAVLWLLRFAHPSLLSAELGLLLGLVAMASMVVGNFGALRQTHLKRMLGYSSIAQVGFALLCLWVPGSRGAELLMLFLGVYVLMTAGAFLVADLWEERLGALDYANLKGQGRRHLLLFLFTAVVLFALVGLPPTGGFMAKLLVVVGLVSAQGGAAGQLGIWLIVMALLTTALGAFFYLRPLYQLVVKKDKGTTVRRQPLSWISVVLIVVTTFGLILTFVQPQLLFFVP